MQAFLSRVAQSGTSCRCPQCLRSVKAVGRRTTASATNQNLRYFTTSTFLYSTIIAAAATLDGAQKRERREKWDDAISGLKKELGRPDLGPSMLKSLGENDGTVPRDTVTDLDSDTLELGASALGPALWPENTGPPLRCHRLPPQSIYAPEHVKLKAQASRYSLKKLESLQLSMDILALRLATDLTERGLHTEASSLVPTDYAKRLFLPAPALESLIRAKKADLASLHSASPNLDDHRSKAVESRLCKYRQDDSGHFHATVADLNAALRALFKTFMTPGSELQIPGLLAKIAYNISNSSAPPNVETYNTLLIGFSRPRSCRHLVDHVVTSLRETHMRPNELTLETVLRHYTRTDNARGFVYFVDLMRGKHGGLMRARPDLTRINETSAKRLVWKKGREGGKAIQLPHPSPSVFAALLEGVIRFSGLDAALKMQDAMAENEWGLGMQGYDLLLQECANTNRWSEGVSTWYQLLQLERRTSSRRGESAKEQISQKAVVSMLRLCKNCQKANMHKQVLQYATLRGWSRRRLTERRQRQAHATLRVEGEKAQHTRTTEANDEVRSSTQALLTGDAAKEAVIQAKKPHHPRLAAQPEQHVLWRPGWTSVGRAAWTRHIPDELERFQQDELR